MFNYNEKVIPAFPDAEKINEFFSGYHTHDTNPNAINYYPETLRIGEIESQYGSQYRKSKGYIQGWLTFSRVGNGEYIDSLDVKPSKMLVDWVNNNMIVVDRDRIYFEAIVFDTYIDLYANYNQIIGSRLLARLPIKQLEEMKEN